MPDKNAGVHPSVRDIDWESARGDGGGNTPSDPVRQAQRHADWWRGELQYRLKRHMKYASAETLRVFIVQLDAYMQAVNNGDVKPPNFSV